MNIAVVDDEEAIREQIGGFIKKRNPDFHISGFATGEGLLAAGTGFDMIFLDVQMEGMGGIEAARTLRQSGGGNREKEGAEGKQIFIRAKNLAYTLNLNGILYIESRGKKVEIHTIDMEEVIESYATMDELEGQLGDGFYRCHRGYLVNMAHIARYDADSIFLFSGERPAGSVFCHVPGILPAVFLWELFGNKDTEVSCGIIDCGFVCCAKTWRRVKSVYF